MKANKKTHLYVCEETSCKSYKECPYGIPHICKRSHTNRYCWLGKRVNCIPSSKKIIYTRCSEARFCNRSRGSCGWAKPGIRTRFPDTCPYDNRAKITFEEYDIDMLGKTPDNEYLRRMGY